MNKFKKVCSKKLYFCNSLIGKRINRINNMIRRSFGSNILIIHENKNKIIKINSKNKIYLLFLLLISESKSYSTI